MTEFFNHIVCLTQKERKDRQFDFERECSKYGINGSYYFAESSDLSDGAKFDSFCKSQLGMLRQFLASGAEVGLLLEDDVQFRSLHILDKAISQLPRDWDVLYLGANLIGVDINRLPEPTQYSENLFALRGAWTSHAIAYTRKIVEYIVCAYEGWGKSG